MPKRAKTAEHDALGIKAIRWIAGRSTGRGIRGSTEVQLTQSYLADAACLGSLQHRYFLAYCKASGLEPFCRSSWPNGQWKTTGDIGDDWLMVFEAKRTRADFLATFGDPSSPRLTPIGSLHWLVTPAGLIRPDELHDWWGILETRGNGLREVRMPRLFPVPEARLHAVASELVWHHRYGQYGRDVFDAIESSELTDAHLPPR